MRSPGQTRGRCLASGCTRARRWSAACTRRAWPLCLDAITIMILHAWPSSVWSAEARLHMHCAPGVHMLHTSVLPRLRARMPSPAAFEWQYHRLKSALLVHGGIASPPTVHRWAQTNPYPATRFALHLELLEPADLRPWMCAPGPAHLCP